MRLFLVVLFLTLVGSFSAVLAAPNAEMPKPSKEVRESSAPRVPIESIENMGLAEPTRLPEGRVLPPVAPRSTNRLWSWRLQAGLLVGQLTKRDEVEQVPSTGFTASWNHRHDGGWDFAFDLGSGGLLHFSAARRTDFGVDFESAPYWKLGVSQNAEASRFIAGTVDLENVKADAAVGLADLFQQDHAWNCEVGFGWGMKGFATQVQLGYRLPF